MSRGNFAPSHQRPTLAQRLSNRRDYNRRLAAQDAKNRCATCKQALPAKAYVLWGEDGRAYCRVLCLPLWEAS